MPPRSLFENRKPKKAPSDRRLHAVESRAPVRRSNPEGSSQPKTDWKPIVIGAVISAAVFTVVGAVLGRVVTKALDSKPLKALGLGEEKKVSPAENPAAPGFSFPAAPHVAVAPPTPLTPYSFHPNPWASSNLSRPMALPMAPHVGQDVVDEREPSYFRAFRQDMERRYADDQRRLAKIESYLSNPAESEE